MFIVSLVFMGRLFGRVVIVSVGMGGEGWSGVLLFWFFLIGVFILVGIGCICNLLGIDF